MATHSAAALVVQIQGCNGFFSSQAALLPPDMQRATTSSLAKSIASQIAVLPSVTVQDAAQLNTAIESSVFAQEEKALLAQAVTKACMSYQSGQIFTTRRSTQMLRHPHAFLTASDWEVLESPSILVSQKISRMVDRLARIGLRNPSEVTVKSMAALIACVHLPSGQPSQLHAMVLECKTACHGHVAAHSRLQHPVT